MDEDVEFLESKVRGVLEPMIGRVISENPENPVKFMIDWLNTYLGLASQNTEKEELENLRKEMSKYKKKYAEEDQEMEAQSEDEDITKEEQDNYDKEVELKSRTKIKGSLQRISVSAEAFGAYNKQSDYVPKVVPKTEAQKEIIKSKMLQNFMFNSLDEKDLTTVIDAFEEKKVSANEVVITEGEAGDVVYLIESGELKCLKKLNGVDTEIKTYVPGEAFGELALLYNAPRAATIIANTDSVLWGLGRECFNSIVKGAAIKKREKYENELKKVEILKSVDDYEIMQICDALQVRKVNAGEKIITQNEKGDKFYILEEGEAYATKLIDGKEENVMDYKVGSYFGELALLKNEPRAANVIAKTNCVLLTLDRMSFKRLLGPLENILKRNSEEYVKYMNSK